MNRPASSPATPQVCAVPLQATTRLSGSPIALISSVVRSRLPRVPSLRRTLSVSALSASRDVDVSSAGSSSPDYDSAVVLQDRADQSFPLYAGNDVSARRAAPTLDVAETKSGISWKFASQGISLLGLAAQESSSTNRVDNSDFTRQIYLHAITYLLRGLPTDMTAEEQMGLRAALPPGTVEPIRVEFRGNPVAPGRPREPSLLHRTLASTIVQIFIILQFVLPYIKILLHTLYEYERQHHISQRVLKQSIELVDVVGKQGIGVTAALYDMGDGKVGQIITEYVSWFIEGVAGGIHDGLGEGMVIIGARPPIVVEQVRE